MSTPRQAPTLTAILTLATLGATSTALAQEGPRRADAFERVWQTTGDSWTAGVLILPNQQEVLTHSGAAAHILDLRDGSSRLRFDFCYGPDEKIAAIDDRRFVAVCSDTIDTIDASKARPVKRSRVRLKSAAQEAAFSSQSVAAALEDNTVQIYGLKDLKLRSRHAFEAEIEGLALSPDGATLALTLKGGAGWLVDVATDARRPLEGGGLDSAMRFSPDGRLLLVDGSGFGLRLFDVASGAVIETFKTGSWMTGAAFLGNGLIAATGSSGHAIYRRGHPEPLTLDQNTTGEHLDASLDGRIFCAGSRAGAVSCFRADPAREAALDRADADAAAAAEAEARRLADLKANEAPLTGTDPFDPSLTDPALPPYEEPASYALSSQDLLTSGIVLTGLGTSPFLISSLNKDVQYPEALLISAASTLGVLALGGGIAGVVVGLDIIDEFGEMMDELLKIPIIGVIIGIPIVIVGVAAAGALIVGGAALALGSPLIFGFGMSAIDGLIGAEPDNPLTLTLTNTAAASIGLLSYYLWTEGLDVDEDIAFALTIATGVALTSLSHGLFREIEPSGADAEKPTLIFTPVILF